MVSRRPPLTLHEIDAMPPKTKEEIVHEYRIQAIREAAGRVMAERGVAGATMEAVAEAAGIAKGTIYLYFKNREDLLQQVADHLFAGLHERVSAAFAEPAPFAARLEMLVGTILGFFDDNRDFMRLFRDLAECPVEGEGGERHRDYQAFVDTLSAWLARARDRGEVRDLPPERAALLVAGAVHEVIRQRVGETAPPPVAEETRWLVAALVGGLAAPVA